MTLDEIKQRLHELRYRGKWSLRKLKDQTGLSVNTIIGAMDKRINEKTQARLSAVLPMIRGEAPKRKTIVKHKPGHKKRYLIRYYNLTKWLSEIEKEPGLTVRFQRRKQYGMSRDRAAFVCAKLDYQMKFHLLALFGARMKQKKIVLGDCYPVEKWIERINKALPGVSVALFKRITKREITRRAS